MASVQRSHEKPETRYVDDHHSYRPSYSVRIEGDKPWWAFGFRRPYMENFIPGESTRGRFSEHSRAAHRFCDRPSLTLVDG
jgi:hypothetical protein